MSEAINIDLYVLMLITFCSGIGGAYRQYIQARINNDNSDESFEKPFLSVLFGITSLEEVMFSISLFGVAILSSIYFQWWSGIVVILSFYILGKKVFGRLLSAMIPPRFNTKWIWIKFAAIPIDIYAYYLIFTTFPNSFELLGFNIQSFLIPLIIALPSTIATSLVIYEEISYDLKTDRNQ